nr:cytochrome c-type biogenesis protein [uncultured Roseateles sp.]
MSARLRLAARRLAPVALGALIALTASGASGAPEAGTAAVSAAAPAAAIAELEARESRLAHQLRCVVCQNQTLAESNAPLAADMRQAIREQLRDGRSDAEVVAFFEARYGAFVRYLPPWRPSTWLLWAGPFLLLGAGLAAALHRRGAFARGAALEALADEAPFDPDNDEFEEGRPA